jgi:hypothetical protein
MWLPPCNEIILVRFQLAMPRRLFRFLLPKKKIKKTAVNKRYFIRLKVLGLGFDSLKNTLVACCVFLKN